MCSCKQRQLQVATAAPKKPPTAAPRVMSRRLEPPKHVVPKTVSPSTWGPHLWTAIHIAAEFSNNIAVFTHWQALKAALTTGLPCSVCASHYTAWYKSGKVFDRTNFFNDNRIWFVALHNDVNRRNGKETWGPGRVASFYGGDRRVKLGLAREAVRKIVGVVNKSVTDKLTQILDILG